MFDDPEKEAQEASTQNQRIILALVTEIEKGSTRNQHIESAFLSCSR